MIEIKWDSNESDPIGASVIGASDLRFPVHCYKNEHNLISLMATHLQDRTTDLVTTREISEYIYNSRCKISVSLVSNL
jgi:hypothetical protein